MLKREDKIRPEGGQNIILETRDLSHSFWQKKGFFSRRKKLWAVRDASIQLQEGKTLGLIGESGCGKSTLARTLSGLMPPSCGEVFIKGHSLYNKNSHVDYKAFRKKLSSSIQMIFQDPNSSLNPRMRIGESVAEPLICQKERLKKQEIKTKVAEVLQEVGISKDNASNFPHAFSGGQRQRIAIARALISQPKILLCDEPTSSLDSSVQAQILNLLDKMQRQLGLSLVFISHDLAVVRHMSDSVAVMYAGYIVESGEAKEVFNNPMHPYTELLLDSVPSFGFLDRARKAEEPMKGVEGMHSLGDRACAFAPRCPKLMKECWEAQPALRKLTGANGKIRRLRCILE